MGGQRNKGREEYQMGCDMRRDVYMYSYIHTSYLLYIHKLQQENGFVSYFKPLTPSPRNAPGFPAVTLSHVDHYSLGSTAHGMHGL